MKEYIELLKERALERFYPICMDKYKLVCDAMEKTQGEPIIIRRAKTVDNVLRNIPISIRDFDVIVGHGASKPGALETH